MLLFFFDMPELFLHCIVEKPPTPDFNLITGLQNTQPKSNLKIQMLVSMYTDYWVLLLIPFQGPALMAVWSIRLCH